MSLFALEFVIENVEDLVPLVRNFEIHFNILHTLGMIESEVIKQAGAIIRVWCY
jgi:hypothetical protein